MKEMDGGYIFFALTVSLRTAAEAPVDREKPVASPEQVEAALRVVEIIAETAKSFGHLGFAMGKETGDKLAAFLAARDAEIIRAWREAVDVSAAVPSERGNEMAYPYEQMNRIKELEASLAAAKVRVTELEEEHDGWKREADRQAAKIAEQGEALAAAEIALGQAKKRLEFIEEHSCRNPPRAGYESTPSIQACSEAIAKLRAAKGGV